MKIHSIHFCRLDFFGKIYSFCILKLFLVFLFSFYFSCTFANKIGTKTGSIPFQKVGGYIVITVKINESTPLNFILDTGVRNIIITELFPEDVISLNYSSTINLHGLGSGSMLKALSSCANTISASKFTIENLNVFVLENDIFNLSQHLGQKINGIIGIDFFEGNIVEINYSKERINFYDSNGFKVPKGYGTMPITIEKRKMYIQLSILELDSDRRSIKMLIDTGAELNAWFQTITNEAVHLPSKGVQGKIGQGLNGEVTGIFARVPQLCIGEFCLKNPIVAFPDSAAIANIIFGSDRDGTIGSQILSRFNLFIDYNNKNFYFKPNHNFEKPFSYNIAGIEIGQVIPFTPQTEVLNVWKGSPAEMAGVQIGDQIMEVNGNKAFQMSISEINMFFETPSKYPLHLVLKRDNEDVFLKIEMKSKI